MSCQSRLPSPAIRALLTSFSFSMGIVCEITSNPHREARHTPTWTLLTERQCLNTPLEQSGVPSGTQPLHPIHIRQESNTGLPPRAEASKSGLVCNVCDVGKLLLTKDIQQTIFLYTLDQDEHSTSIPTTRARLSFETNRTVTCHQTVGNAAFDTLPTSIWTSLWPQC